MAWWGTTWGRAEGSSTGGLLGEFTTLRTWMAQKLDLISASESLVSGMLTHISKVHRD